jgi:hypothetical protein
MNTLKNDINGYLVLNDHLIAPSNEIVKELIKTLF